MSMFLHRHTMAWALVLWNAYVLAWTVITGAGPALMTVWALAGTIVLVALCLATQSSVPRASTGRRNLFHKPSPFPRQVASVDAGGEVSVRPAEPLRS